MKSRLLILLTVLFVGIQPSVSGKNYDIVVAQDGSGNFRTVQEAVNAVKDNNPERTTIFIRRGVYHEHVEIPATKINLSLIGENAENTVIYDTLCVRSVNRVTGEKLSRTETTTFVIFAADFYAENLTFENNSQVRAQALAVSVEGPRAKFKNCRLVGFQDTLYISGKSYFQNCYISGTTDFIYGPATAVFRDCIIHSRRGNYLTASSAPQESRFGFVFLNCVLTSEPGVLAYLGRPWRDYANVAFIRCEMGAHIRPEGWHNWDKPEREKTAIYVEYNSKGPGANIDNRVKWSRQLTKQEAKEYTIKNVLTGDDNWDYRKP